METDRRVRRPTASKLTASGVRIHNVPGRGDFLLAARGILASLGEHPGVIQHATSVGRRRTPPVRPPLIGREELTDVFLDFEDGMAPPISEAKNALAI